MCNACAYDVTPGPPSTHHSKHTSNPLPQPQPLHTDTNLNFTPRSSLPSPYPALTITFILPSPLLSSHPTPQLRGIHGEGRATPREITPLIRWSSAGTALPMLLLLLPPPPTDHTISYTNLNPATSQPQHIPPISSTTPCSSPPRQAMLPISSAGEVSLAAAALRRPKAATSS